MCKVRNVKMCVLCLLSVINCFGLYLMSACSVHIHIHRNKAVLLLFCLCFLVSLSFHFHLSAASACCATSIPRNNTAYPFHAFLYSSLLLSLLLSTLMNMVAAGLRFWPLGHHQLHLFSILCWCGCFHFSSKCWFWRFDLCSHMDSNAGVFVLFVWDLVWLESFDVKLLNLESLCCVEVGVRN